jgi:RimJ/RimL family protein N-acetyltransferase
VTDCLPLALSGRCVRLEPLSEAHLDGLLAAASVSRETYELTFVPSAADAMLMYIRRLRSDATAGTVIPLATIHLPSGRVVGSTSFLNIERWRWPAGSAMQRPATEPDVVEIGATWLAHDVQRTAINTEAKLLMLGHAFDRWDVHRVSLKTDVRNARSRAAIERLGAKLDAYSDRGKGDLYHHDIEDVVAVVDGRVELHGELAAAGEGVRRYVVEQVRGLSAACSSAIGTIAKCSGVRGDDARWPARSYQIIF